MKSTRRIGWVWLLGVLGAVALAATNAPANADEIKLPVDDPAFGGGLISSVPSPGDGPRVTYDRDYGTGGRREVGLDPINPLDQIKLPFGDDHGLMGWLWNIRRLLDVISV